MINARIRGYVEFTVYCDEVRRTAIEIENIINDYFGDHRRYCDYLGGFSCDDDVRDNVPVVSGRIDFESDGVIIHEEPTWLEPGSDELVTDFDEDMMMEIYREIESAIDDGCEYDTVDTEYSNWEYEACYD